MDVKALGSTGIEVSVIGTGTWGFGGDLWKDADPSRDLQALRLALDSGCTLVDTALFYGEGEAEKLVGEAVRDVGGRDRVTVATKVPPADRKFPARPGARLADAFPPAYLQTCVEDSLRNLGAEALAVEQLHVWRDEWLDEPAWPEVRGTMERMIREGKVLHWGVSLNAHEPGSGLRAVAEPIVEVVQVIFNIFDPSAREELFPAAADHEVGILARCPFDEGALTGGLPTGADPREVFPKGDFRRWYFREDRLAQLDARLAPLRELLGDHARTLAELALRFAITPPEVSAAIPGMRKPEHVQANLACGSRPALSGDVLERLAELSWDKNWYR